MTSLLYNLSRCTSLLCQHQNISKSQKWKKWRQKRKEKRANKPRKPVNISRRVYLLFGVVFVLFLLLFARLTYMQVYNKSFYTKKLEDNSKYTVRIASERGQIFDAKGIALTTNQSKDVITFTCCGKIGNFGDTDRD